MLGTEGVKFFGMEIAFDLGLTGKLLVGAGIAAVWMVVAIYTGWVHDKGEKAEAEAS